MRTRRENATRTRRGHEVAGFTKRDSTLKSGLLVGNRANDQIQGVPEKTGIYSGESHAKSTEGSLKARLGHVNSKFLPRAPQLTQTTEINWMRPVGAHAGSGASKTQRSAPETARH